MLLISLQLYFVVRISGEHRAPALAQRANGKEKIAEEKVKSAG